MNNNKITYIKKVINPCECEVYSRSSDLTHRNAFAEIIYKEGSLSIHGVVAPLPNGDCLGSAGQCVEDIKRGFPTVEWTPELLELFCNIWDRWHLNDMNTMCEHQHKLGWKKELKKEIIFYHYTLNSETKDKIKELKQRIFTELIQEGVTRVTDEEAMLLSLEEFIVLEQPIEEYGWLEDMVCMARYYKPFTSYNCKKGTNEEYATRQDCYPIYYKPENKIIKHHPDGMLCKPCPICGHRYGEGWLKEEVPDEILEFLDNLPETKVKPAWI